MRGLDGVVVEGRVVICRRCRREGVCRRHRGVAAASRAAGSRARRRSLRTFGGFSRLNFGRHDRPLAQ